MFQGVVYYIQGQGLVTQTKTTTSALAEGSDSQVASERGEKMKITNIGNGRISIETPYNPEFVRKIKKAGGRWNGATKCWETDERNIEAVRTIMKDVYGMDDMPQETVTVKIKINDTISKHCAPIVMFGRTIAAAYGRDSGARVGDGVCFESGKCTSGGSAKNWYTYIEENSVILVHDVPKNAVEQKLGWHDSYGEFEIMEKANPNAALLAEKEALLKRLAEIEELLQG